VRSVAAECGYDDALAFSKVFKSRFGLNPSEYRHAHMTRKEAGRQDISAEEMEEDSHKEQD
jgi:AraC-like DNA-binding protein